METVVSAAPLARAGEVDLREGEHRERAFGASPPQAVDPSGAAVHPPPLPPQAPTSPAAGAHLSRRRRPPLPP